MAKKRNDEPNTCWSCGKEISRLNTNESPYCDECRDRCEKEVDEIISNISVDCCLDISYSIFERAKSDYIASCKVFLTRGSSRSKAVMDEIEEFLSSEWASVLACGEYIDVKRFVRNMILEVKVWMRLRD